MRNADDIQSQQEVNLHRNWEERKATAIVIASHPSCSVLVWKDKMGRVVFYVVKGDFPMGYIYCHQYPTYLQIGSAYISPDYQRRGLGTLTYKDIIRYAGEVVSDSDLSLAAQALWAKLKQDPDLRILDIGRGRFIATLM